MSMLPINAFKRALREGRAQIGLWSTIPSPFVCEMIGGAGYDWVLLDTEHTPTDVPLMLGQLQAVAAARPAPGWMRRRPASGKGRWPRTRQTLQPSQAAIEEHQNHDTTPRVPAQRTLVCAR